MKLGTRFETDEPCERGVAARARHPQPGEVKLQIVRGKAGMYRIGSFWSIASLNSVIL